MEPDFVRANKTLIEETVYQWLTGMQENAVHGSAVFGGGNILRLEKMFSGLFSVKYAVAVSSGTAALHCALNSLNLEASSVVYILGSKWRGISALVHAMRLRPVYIDSIDKLMSIKSSEQNLKVIIFVRSNNDLVIKKEIKRLSSKRNFFVIEDWSAVKPLNFTSLRIPNIGQLGVFSFGYGKFLQCGEGGILLTNSLKLYARSVRFSQHPIYCKARGIKSSGIGESALNYRIHPLSAFLACAQLDHFKKQITARSLSPENHSLSMGR